MYKRGLEAVLLGREGNCDPFRDDFGCSLGLCFWHFLSIRVIEIGGCLLNMSFYVCHNGMVRGWEFGLNGENHLEGVLSFVCGLFE